MNIIALATAVLIAVNPLAVKRQAPMTVDDMAAHCEISTEDFELFAGVVEAESNRQIPEEGQQTTEGRVYIALTIWNRTYNDLFPDDPRSVLCQSGQFSTVRGGVSCTQPTSYSRQAVIQAYDWIHSGEEYPEVLFFNCISYFRGREAYGVFGGNYFSL